MADVFEGFLKDFVKGQSQANEMIAEIAAASKFDGKYSQAQIDEAIETKELNKKLVEKQTRFTGLTEERILQQEGMKISINKQEEYLKEQSEELKKLGIAEEGNAAFRQESMKLERMKLANAKASGSKEAEKAAKEAIYKLREQTFLGRIANGITDIKKAAKEKIKSGLKKGFGTFAFGALAVAAIAFLNSPMFTKTVDYINKTLIPKITHFYDSFFGPEGGFVKGFSALFGDIGGIGGIVLGLGTVAALFTAAKIKKIIGPLKNVIGKIFKGIGGLKDKLPKLPGGAKGAGPGAGTKISQVAGNLKKSAISAGKGIGGFFKGVLKGIAGGLSAIAAPAVLVGLAAVTAAIILMEDSFEPLGKLVESVGKAVKSTFEGIGEIVESIGTGIGTMITKIGDSIGNIIDKVSKMKSAGTDATTKQIKELSKIPAEPMLAVANGINAMKKALDGFGGGTLSKIAGSLFDGGGPIDKIVELTKKVPELMKAAEAISVLGQAGSNYAVAEQELARRKRIGELQKDLATGDVDGQDNAKNVAKAQAELAALQGQSMPMSGNIGGNLGKIEKLVQEIVTMKREAAKGGGNVVTDASVKVNANRNVSLGGNPTPLTNSKTFAYDGQV